jgi:hypothetical protein
LEPNASPFEGAFKIFIYLLKHGEFTDHDRELIRLWRTPEVRDVLRSIVMPQAEVDIFEVKGTIYITPIIGSKLFSYKNEEIKKAISLKTNRELYTAYFVMLCLISMYFSGEDVSSTRNYVPVQQLEQYISTYMTEVLASSEEDLNNMEDESGLPLKAIAETWDDLDPFNPEIKNLRRASKNRVSFILRVCSFFEDEGYLRVGMLQVLEESEIRLLPKIEHFISHAYYNDRRKDELLEFLKKSLPPLKGKRDASDTQNSS